MEISGEEKLRSVDTTLHHVPVGSSARSSSDEAFTSWKASESREWTALSCSAVAALTVMIAMTLPLESESSTCSSAILPSLATTRRSAARSSTPNSSIDVAKTSSSLTLCLVELGGAPLLMADEGAEEGAAVGSGGEGLGSGGRRGVVWECGVVWGHGNPCGGGEARGGSGRQGVEEVEEAGGEEGVGGEGGGREDGGRDGGAGEGAEGEGGWWKGRGAEGGSLGGERGGKEGGGAFGGSAAETGGSDLALDTGDRGDGKRGGNGDGGGEGGVNGEGGGGIGETTHESHAAPYGRLRVLLL